MDALLPKIVQTLKLLLLSRTFYFSYDYDITHRLARQHNSSSDMSLYKSCDPNHFWNSQLVTSFIEGNFDDFVLPVMQGFIGQRAFMMDEKPASPEGRGIANVEVADGSSGDPESVSTLVDVATATKQTSFLLTLVSRRSTKRAGFRYMRRGIDGNGYVANAVETEQILSSPQWTDQQVHSFTQTRGSIPLLYTQTPYTFKPAPILHGSKDANQRAFKTHFGHLANEYGQVQAVSLIDRHGPELTIGNAYEQHVDLLNTAGGLNSRPLLFEWFDFHNICRGMKFENVSILMDSLGSFLDTIGWTTRDNDGKLTSLQQGIVRTNCMDCLDRTNVVQSAIAQRILSNQLAQYLPATSSPMTADPTSEALNTLWADNGDAISLTYAGTAALKGDYVRTRRRNLAGVLTDFSLTLSRYYRNLFDDFFAQAVLDYALGNVNESIFTEFQERMTTADPAIDLAKARQSAITAAGNVVVEESEDLIGGWTLSAPAPIANPADATSTSSLPTSKVDTAALRAQPFREVLLLLSDVAIYSISYDWDSEKVLGYERVSLLQLRRLQVGTYITQTLTPSQKDARQNVGLLVEFEMDGKPHMMRTNTLTVGGTGATDVGIVESNDGERWVLAFKSLVRDVSSKRGEQEPRVSERELVKEVEREIVKAFERAQKDARGEHGSTLPGKSIREDGKKEEVRLLSFFSLQRCEPVRVVVAIVNGCGHSLNQAILTLSTSIPSPQFDIAAEIEYCWIQDFRQLASGLCKDNFDLSQSRNPQVDTAVAFKEAWGTDDSEVGLRPLQRRLRPSISPRSISACEAAQEQIWGANDSVAVHRPLQRRF